MAEDHQGFGDILKEADVGGGGEGRGLEYQQSQVLVSSELTTTDLISDANWKRTRRWDMRGGVFYLKRAVMMERL